MALHETCANDCITFVALRTINVHTFAKVGVLCSLVSRSCDVGQLLFDVTNDLTLGFHVLACTHVLYYLHCLLDSD